MIYKWCFLCETYKTCYHRVIIHHTEEKKALLEYNKAQEECINQWTEYPETITKPEHLKQFLEEFTSINPAPDPETYKVSVIYPNTTKRIKLYGDLSLEEAQKRLDDLLKMHMSTPEWKTYNRATIDNQFLQILDKDYRLTIYRIDQ